MCVYAYIIYDIYGYMMSYDVIWHTYEEFQYVPV